MDKVRAHYREPRVLVLGMDRYFLSPIKTPEGLENHDHPDVLDHDRFEQDVLSFLAGRPTMVPVYKYEIGRTGEEELSPPGRLLITEGLYPVYRPTLRDVATLIVKVDAEQALRRARRLQRDTEDTTRGVGDHRSLDETTRKWDLTVVPMEHHIHEQPAHVTIWNNWRSS